MCTFQAANFTGWAVKGLKQKTGSQQQPIKPFEQRQFDSKLAAQNNYSLRLSTVLHLFLFRKQRTGKRGLNERTYERVDKRTWRTDRRMDGRTDGQTDGLINR